MKVMTVLGTRPEIIRLSLIIKKLDKYCEHTLVHTGQNYDDSLNKIFFDDLPNKVAIKIKPSMMTADIIKTGGLVLLKNRTCLIFILDSMEEVLVENRVDNEVII